MDLVELRPEGLYCAPGDFHVDPWRPVERAVITHAHADHARPGHHKYLAAAAGERVLRKRLGDIAVDFLRYGETVDINGVKVSLHPAGHVLGSAQVRIEYGGDVWVVSGDYKLESDDTCTPFEAVRCHTFVTESTFGLPVYRWATPRTIFDDIDAWWTANAAESRTSVLYGYAFGKAQRILAGVDAGVGPIVCHGAVENLNEAYRGSGVHLPATMQANAASANELKRALVLAPPSAQATPWLKRFGRYSDAFASGWMQLRGARRRRGVDRGFVLSDHADWPGLLRAVEETGAQRVIATHGYSSILARWLQQRGLHASVFETEFGNEEAATPAEAEPPEVEEAGA
ncbi:MAG TPA: ligase-associated DNA damage response exonuclease [Burkholderiales bacterium]|nr:ligase-associated DNA damage response exonuclease [Burkholderiales bacterium]